MEKAPVLHGLNEEVIEIKQCKNCSVRFNITDKDLEFYDKVAPVFAGKKYRIPTPTICPECRQKRRICFRNERNLYKNKDINGNTVISSFSEDKDFKLMTPSLWWSSSTDFIEYARDFDFNKSFFEQFAVLLKDVPKITTESNLAENSDYTNCVGKIKDSYMVFASGNSENCYYGNNVERSFFCVDTYLTFGCENCYETSTVFNCNSLKYSFNCRDCNSSSFLIDCTGCSDCFLSVGLKNKKYHILNKSYSKQEYKNIIKSEYSNLSYLEIQKLKKDLEFLNSKTPRKYNISSNITNCVGNDLENCENCANCFIMEESKDCKNSSFCRNSKDMMDFDIFGYPGSLSYESMCCGFNCNKILFSTNCINDVSHIYYSDQCYSSSNLFGCVGLKNKQYCIFNKQYTKQEYNTLVPSIIEHMKTTGEWGEFFPSILSGYGYNESLAHQFFPLKKQEALKQGFNWSDYKKSFPKVKKTIAASKLPDNISKIPDDILNWAIECEITNIPFIIIKPELEFYRKHNLPIPKRHPDQRHLDRMKYVNSRKLNDRDCDKCGISMKTTYNIDEENVVYCEECYNKEIY